MNHNFNFYGYPISVSDENNHNYRCIFRKYLINNHELFIEHYKDKVHLPSGNLLEIHFAMTVWPGTVTLSIIPHFALPSWDENDLSLSQVSEQQAETALIFYSTDTVILDGVMREHVPLALRTLDAFIHAHEDDSRWTDFNFTANNIATMEKWYERQVELCQ